MVEEEVTRYCRLLAGRYGRVDPWIPHSAATCDRPRFSLHLRAEAEAARARASGGWIACGAAGVPQRQAKGSRAALRVINLPGPHPQRRELLEATCVRPLAQAGVDAAFHNGCVGWDLPLDRSRLRGGAQRVSHKGHEYLVDTGLWREAWSLEDLAEVERRQAEMDWFPLAWLSFPKDVMEPQTPGFVGGHISHAEVWREAWQADLDWVMVVEDDAVPSPSYGLTWLDIWGIVAAQVERLAAAKDPWDMLYVGRTPSYTREGPEVTPLIVPAGFCLRTHTYALSRRGLRKLLQSGIASTMTHRPQDEVLASLTLLAAGLWHPRRDFDEELRRLAGPQLLAEPWRALAFKGDGITSPLEDIEDTERARSSTAATESHRAAKELPKLYELVD